MEKKIIFLDMDGTLLNDDKEIPEINRKAIEEARRQGHIFVLASGRVIDSVKKQAVKLGFTGEGCYVIGFNGAVAVDMSIDQIIYRTPVPREHIRPLFDMAYELGLHAQCYKDDSVVTERRDKEIEYYSKKLVAPYHVTDDASTFLKEDPCKLLFIDLNGREKLEILRNKISSYCEENDLDTFYSEKIYLDVVKHGINKGAGISYICKLMGIPLENSIAVGDEENDIAMIKRAGIGCAVANASQAAKASADYITSADNNNGAVAEVIRKFVL